MHKLSQNLSIVPKELSGGIPWSSLLLLRSVLVFPSLPSLGILSCLLPEIPIVLHGEIFSGLSLWTSSWTSSVHHSSVSRHSQVPNQSSSASCHWRERSSNSGWGEPWTPFAICHPWKVKAFPYDLPIVQKITLPKASVHRGDREVLQESSLFR